MSKKNEKKENRVSKFKLLVVIVAAVLVVVIASLVFVIISLMQKEPEPANERPIADLNYGGRGTLVTPENLDEVLASLDTPLEDASYTAKMNSNWHFPSGKEESTNAYVANSTDNTRTVYFDVILTDTSELVYSSPFMPVGTALSGFALDEELEAGTYPAVVVYHLVDDDYNNITTASVNVTLYIEK